MLKTPETELKIISYGTLPPVCGDAEMLFELSLGNGRNSPNGYLILPNAPVLILLETADQVRLVLEHCEVLQKQVGERQSAVIIDERSAAYGFIAADMRFKKVDGWMPFLAARPFKTRPGRHDLCGYLDLSKTFAPDDARIKVNIAVWKETFKNFEQVPPPVPQNDLGEESFGSILKYYPEI